MYNLLRALVCIKNRAFHTHTWKFHILCSNMLLLYTDLFIKFDNENVDLSKTAPNIEVSREYDNSKNSFFFIDIFGWKCSRSHLLELIFGCCVSKKYDARIVSGAFLQRAGLNRWISMRNMEWNVPFDRSTFWFSRLTKCKIMISAQQNDWKQIHFA